MKDASKNQSDVSRELLAYYQSTTRKPTKVTGAGSHRQRRHMSPDWQECCRQAGPYGRQLHGLLVACCCADGDASWKLPVPVTEARIHSVRVYLEASGREAPNRIATFETALRALPPKGRTRILGPGEHPWLDRPQSLRRRNAPKSTFASLEQDLAAWQVAACLPLETEFDEREQLRPDVAGGYARLISCAATILLSAGGATCDLRLADLVSKQGFDAWFETRTDDEGRTVTLATIDAFVRIRRDLCGDDDVVVHMGEQRIGLRDHHALPASAIAELSAMLRSQRTIELLPFALMEISTSDALPARTRLKLANLSPALAAATELALRPGEVFALAHDGHYKIVPDAGCAAQPHSERLTALFRQRERVRAVLGAAAAEAVMSGPGGAPMDNRACDQALARTQEQFGLPRFPWQRLRDFAVVRMLLADPSRLKEAADLLGFRDPALVYLRYAAFLPRGGHAPDQATPGQYGLGGHR